MKNPGLLQEVNRLHADICSALADPTRILILYALAEQPLHVNEIADSLNISQPTVSRHLKTLRERGIVQPERQGPMVIYHLVDERLIQALDLLRDVLRDLLQSRVELVENQDAPGNIHV